MNLLTCDLDYMTKRTAGLWEVARGSRIFVTGGTGFFGRWILESFLAANRLLALDASAVVLTRRPKEFAKSAPHIVADAAIKLLPGDVRNFTFPTDTFDHIVHAATEGGLPPLPTFDTIVEGTRHTLDFARVCGARNFVLLSSGAVYGTQPPSVAFLDESFAGAPVITDAYGAYGESKRVAELLCHLYANDFGIGCKILRCFTFVGAHLPLDSHFAIGNFIADALYGRPLRIKGDGTPLRSYLYMADAMIWLWTVLFRAPALRPYNLGSDQPVSIAELAQIVVETVSPETEVIIEQKAVEGSPVARYVPATHAARQDLGLTVGIDLREAIRRTAAWHKNREGAGVP